jgi:hypothetical protein
LCGLAGDAYDLRFGVEGWLWGDRRRSRMGVDEAMFVRVTVVRHVVEVSCSGGLMESV